MYQIVKEQLILSLYNISDYSSFSVKRSQKQWRNRQDMPLSLLYERVFCQNNRNLIHRPLKIHNLKHLKRNSTQFIIHLISLLCTTTVERIPCSNNLMLGYHLWLDSLEYNNNLCLVCDCLIVNLWLQAF